MRLVLWLTACAIGCQTGEALPYGMSGGAGSGMGQSTGSTDGGTAADTSGTTGTGSTNLIFVMAETIIPGSLGGTDAADAACNLAASSAGIDGEFIAWLGSSTRNPVDLVTGVPGWVRADGRVFVENVTDLVDAGFFAYPPRLDERGNDLGSVPVLTATLATGIAAADATGGDCSGWTDTLDPTAVVGGWSDATLVAWTEAIDLGCNTASHLVCMQIDGTEPAVFAPLTGRGAFLSRASFNSGGGLAVADDLCAGEASAQGIAGSYRALLGDNAASAISRFDLLGEPWVRLDGVSIADDPSLLESGAPLDAPLIVDAQGVQWWGTVAWSGGASLDDDLASSSCSNWLALDAVAFVANADRSAGDWFGNDSRACDLPHRIFCLEE